jgi:thymidylate synthase (FAD)
MVLPQSMLVTWIWTGNLLAFAHVYNLRAKPDAQLEAQEFAKELEQQIPDDFRVGWDALTK